MTDLVDTTKILKALRRTQHEIERLYELEPGPDVGQFVDIDAGHAHESLLVRQVGTDSIELLLLLPADLDLETDPLNDAYLQVIEGVSHFVLLTERARTELPATRLELEIQAEVDKFALLLMNPNASVETREIHHWLFERGQFLHPADTEAGERYRTANDVAAKLCARLYLTTPAPSSRSLLRQFYRCGQAEKLRLALAA